MTLPRSVVDEAHVSAIRQAIADCEALGIPAWERDDDVDPELTDQCWRRAYEAYGAIYEQLAADWRREAEATQTIAEHHERKRRRRFPRRVLERYRLTEPENVCQRCGFVGDTELDHMMELVAGGPDHPHNLVRLCNRCHRAKPYFTHLATFAEWRLAVITWVNSWPHVWRDA